MREEKGIKGFSLEKLEEACAKRGVEYEDVIARYLALTESDAEAAGANTIKLMHEQAKMVKDLADKYEPDLKSVDNKVTGSDGGPVEVTVNFKD